MPENDTVSLRDHLFALRQADRDLADTRKELTEVRILAERERADERFNTIKSTMEQALAVAKETASKAELKIMAERVDILAKTSDERTGQTIGTASTWSVVLAVVGAVTLAVGLWVSLRKPRP